MTHKEEEKPRIPLTTPDGPAQQATEAKQEVHLPATTQEERPNIPLTTPDEPAAEAKQRYNPFSFKGRIGRLVLLGNNIGSGVLFGIATVLEEFDNISFLCIIFYALAAWISLAGCCKRFHDLGKNGWWSLFTCIPLVSFIIGLYLLLSPGDEGSNKYGEKP